MKRRKREIKEVWLMKLLKDVGVTLTSFCLLVCPSLDKHRVAVPWYPSAGQMTYCALSTCDATLHTHYHLLVFL